MTFPNGLYVAAATLEIHREPAKFLDQEARHCLAQD
jgi:hypothetical protein